MMTVTVDVREAVEALGKRAPRAIARAVRKGYPRGLDLLASRITTKAREMGVPQRTGTLLQSPMYQVTTNDESRASGFVGIDQDYRSKEAQKRGLSPAGKYAYLLGDEVVTITPVGKKALTIPCGANLTAAGVPRYPTFASLKERFGEKVITAWPWIGVRVGVRRNARVDIYFWVTGRTTVRGRGVMKHVIAEAPTIVAEPIADEIRRELGAV